MTVTNTRQWHKMVGVTNAFRPLEKHFNLMFNFSNRIPRRKKGEVPSRIDSLGQVSGVLGCQWGDEGKGKLVDILAKHFDVVARCQVLSFPYKLAIRL